MAELQTQNFYDYYTVQYELEKKYSINLRDDNDGEWRRHIEYNNGELFTMCCEPHWDVKNKKEIMHKVYQMFLDWAVEQGENNAISFYYDNDKPNEPVGCEINFQMYW